MREASAKYVGVYIASIWDHPMGGASPTNYRSTPTEMVLQEKNRYSELEAWQPGTSEGRCLEGKEEDHA